MDKIRTAIADKVLEISNSDNSDVKDKLQKVNRFRDFTDACQTLILKYPNIETELLKMIENNDFDARIASSRVDTIIRLSETNSSNEPVDIKKDIETLDEISEANPIQGITSKIAPIVEINEIQQTVKEQPLIDEPDIKELSEGVDPIPNLIENKKEEEYVDFEEITEEEEVKTTTTQQETQKLDTNDNNETIKKVLLIVGIVIAVVVLIFVIKFIINNWQIILWILGGCIIAAGVVWLLLKKK